MNASDKGTPSQHVETPAIVEIVFTDDVTKEAPQWNTVNSVDIDDYILTGLEETVNAPSYIQSFTASCPNCPASFTYYLRRGQVPEQNSQHSFLEVTNSSGMHVTVNEKLDYETVPKYMLKLRVSVS